MVEQNYLIFGLTPLQQYCLLVGLIFTNGFWFMSLWILLQKYLTYKTFHTQWAPMIQAVESVEKSLIENTQIKIVETYNPPEKWN